MTGCDCPVMSPQPASTGPGAMYPAIVTDQIREARRELVGAPLAQVATEAACALVDACAALAEIAGRQRLTGEARDRRAQGIDALSSCAAEYLALADLSTARREAAQRAADEIVRAFEDERDGRPTHSPPTEGST